MPQVITTDAQNGIPGDTTADTPSDAPSDATSDITTVDTPNL